MSSQDCHLSVNHSKVKIFIDICNSLVEPDPLPPFKGEGCTKGLAPQDYICNAAKIMLLGKGSSLAVGVGVVSFQ